MKGCLNQRVFCEPFPIAIHHNPSQTQSITIHRNPSQSITIASQSGNRSGALSVPAGDEDGDALDPGAERRSLPARPHDCARAGS